MKKQQGFTLIELMIVIAIIGVIATLAVPNFIDYMKRQKVAEGVRLMEPVKTIISEFVVDKSFVPDSSAFGVVPGINGVVMPGSAGAKYFDNLAWTQVVAPAPGNAGTGYIGIDFVGAPAGNKESIDQTIFGAGTIYHLYIQGCPQLDGTMLWDPWTDVPANNYNLLPSPFRKPASTAC